MSQAPMMPIYPDALLGDTLHLSAEQLGAYLLLLFATWRNNGKPLPDDDRKLARICRSTTAHWRRALRPTVIEFFQTDDGFLHQKRLESEWNLVREKIEINKLNGASGGAATALKWRQSTIGDRYTEPTSEPKGEKEGERPTNPDPYPEKKRESLVDRTSSLPREAEPDTATRPSPKSLKKVQESEVEPPPRQSEAPEGWLAEAEAARDEAGLEPVNLPLEWAKFAARAEGPVERRRWIEWSLRAWVAREPQRYAGGTRGFVTAAEAVAETPWAARMRQWHREGWWLPAFGPRPGEPGCFVPAQYLAEAAE